MTARQLLPSTHAPPDSIALAPNAQRPLHIALLGYRSHPHVGGQGIYLKYLSRALAQLGHQVDVISGPPYPELDDKVRLIKIPSLDLYQADNHLTALRWRHLRSFSDSFEWWTMATGGFAEPYTFGRRVAQYLRKHGRHYDVIHDNQSLSYGLLQLQHEGFPVVATVHHPITRDREAAVKAAPAWGDRLLVKRWYSFLKMQKRVIQNLQHLVTVSHFSRDDVAQQFKRSREGIEVVSNGIDTELFRPLPEIARIPFRLLTTTSSDQAIKGFSVLLHALNELRQQFPQIHLVVIGKLKADSTNARLLQQLKLADIITFKNSISDQALVQEYAQASVVVCPSLYEGFGMPAAEAMSAGVPLVSSDGGALSEVVAEAGLLVPAGNSAALAEAIRRVLNDPLLAQQLSALGRQRIQQHFCWQRVAQQMTHYYHAHLVNSA